MTPAGEMYMTSSSFQTENCWMYFGRQPISHAPYRCMSSAFAAYLSAGLIGGTRRPVVASGSLWACRIFGWFGETTTWGCRVEVNVRTLPPLPPLRRARAVLLDRIAEPKARWFCTLIAITEGNIFWCQLHNESPCNWGRAPSLV